MHQKLIRTKLTEAIRDAVDLSQRSPVLVQKDPGWIMEPADMVAITTDLKNAFNSITWTNMLVTLVNFTCRATSCDFKGLPNNALKVEV